MKYAASVDIGGTSTRVALISQTGDIIERQSFTTLGDNPHATLEGIYEIIQSFSEPCVGVGVSCPGPLDLKKGIVLTPPNLTGWHYFKFKEEAEKLWNLPVILENDANLAGYAEAMKGAGVGEDVVQYFTISTGLGGGLVINENIFLGSHGFAQEVANAILWKDGPQLGDLKPGSVESICSGTAITQRAKQQGLDAHHAGDVYQLAQTGNMVAEAIIDDAIEYLANMIAIVIGVIDPGVVVLGGGVALKIPNFVEKVTERVQTKVYAVQVENVNIKRAELGDDNGLIGGGLYAFNVFAGGML